MMMIPLNAELNPICYLLALLGAHHFLHVSRIRVKKNSQKQYHKRIHLGIHVKNCYSCMIFNETRILSKDFRKMLQYQISRKSGQWEQSCSLPTEGRTERQFREIYVLLTVHLGIIFVNNQIFLYNQTDAQFVVIYDCLHSS